jgi:hypothetical protein
VNVRLQSSNILAYDGAKHSRMAILVADVALEGDFDSIPYRANPAVRGPASLPIRFEAQSTHTLSSSRRASQ